MTTPPYQIQNLDAVEFLKGLGSESVDLLVTDPAYESLEKHRKIGTTTRLKNWFPVFPNKRYKDFFDEAYRVMKKDAHCYVMSDSESMFLIKPIAENAGFRFWKPLVWDKVNIGMGYHYRARHEYILFFEKGKRKLNDLSMPDVLSHKRVYNGYPTEKPVDLFKDLIKQSSNPGDLVIDPFAGSGATGEAALKLGREFKGSDIAPRSVATMSTRFSQLK